MPRTYLRPFRVRYYECDPYGHVNNANYLRYATQAAIDASTDAGYGPEQYQALGTTWFIREAGLTYHRPAREGELINVKTWVSDFRRVRSRREYEMTAAESGEAVASVYTDWVYLNTATRQPARISPELIAAFFPEGAPAEAPAREPFPGLPPAPPGAFTMRRRVGWHQLDTAGHMNSAWYLGLVEEASLEAAEHVGWPITRVAQDGLGLVAREHRIEFQRQLLMGEDVLVTTYFGSVRRTSIVRYYAMQLPSGEPVARAQTVWVCIDLNTRRPAQIPEAWMRDFAPQRASVQ